ncbi:PREDICTED: phospholipase A2 [Myotis brandtii]|uniref:phospholipase A2 n=1 Tax=Myotis brandtii TaxID=109478 RepID=UPI0007045701|nr:PREDICTED: phospholipase A2 [Myotis brandtii]
MKLLVLAALLTDAGGPAAPHLLLPQPFPLLHPRCCQTHDRCYDQAKKLDTCKFLLDNPYTKSYSYKCSGSEIICSSKNKPCQAFICECDRKAAICFSKAPYNKEHKNLNTKKFCQD